MKTYIASDLHIGYEDSNYEAINQFLDIVNDDAGELILLGDVLDLWRNTFDNISTEEPYKTSYEKLIRLSYTVPTTIIRGNHDYNIKRYIKGSKIKFRRRVVKNNIMLIHGWEFDVKQVALSPFFLHIAQIFPHIYQKFFYKPRCTLRYSFDYENTIAGVAEKYAEKCGYRYVIFGHQHIPYVRSNIINCGDMVEHKSYVVIDGNDVELRVLK